MIKGYSHWSQSYVSSFVLGLFNLLSLTYICSPSLKSLLPLTYHFILLTMNFHLFITIIHSFPYLLFHVAGSSLYTQKGSFLLWTSKKGNKKLILLLPTMSSLLKKFNINFIKIQINKCIYFFFEWNLSWGIIFLKRRLMYSVTALVDSWSTEEPTNHVLRFPWIL